jgi:asparagine synthase (glutamine-hydrolysing)
MENEKYYLENLKKLLDKSISKLPKNNLAIAFSGGVDSCILAKLIKNKACYTVGIKNCGDFSSAESASKELNLKLKKIVLNEREIKEAVPIQAEILKKLYKKTNDDRLRVSFLSISYNLPLFFVAKYAKEKNIVLGQGPDEMLGGYKRYLEMSKINAVKEMNDDAKFLFEIKWLQNKETLKYFKKDIFLPYLDKEIVEFCKNIPYNLRINITGKYILRKLAENLGISREISFRAKRAAQYGTGIMKIMKKINNTKFIAD